MTDNQILEFALEACTRAGAQEAQCQMRRTARHEMNVEAGEINLVRTTFDSHMGLTVLLDQQKGSIGLNKLDRESIERSAGEAVDIASSAEADPAYGIAAQTERRRFHVGAAEPDRDRMYDVLREFIAETKKRFPKTLLENVFLDFTQSHQYLLNTHGTDLAADKGIYHGTAVFTSRDGKHTSSFNYSDFAAAELTRPFMDHGTLVTLLRQSGEHTATQAVPAKFVGDVVVTPDCLHDFVSFLVDVSLRDSSLISGSSVYKDKLGQVIASPQFSLRSEPYGGRIVDGYFWTGDGFAAEHMDIVKAGVLESFVLSLYGANKTGLARGASQGGAYIVEAGETPYEEMIGSISQGLLLARYSGGYPNQDGDFSGVAKNSYYIADGRIRYPVSETMVSGNLTELFQNIQSISCEQVDFGTARLPWVCFRGVTVSGR